jgi:hypothetical protein
MTNTEFPYVNNYGKLSELFEAIINAPEPSKFTHEILQKILGRQSPSDRPMISFLKRLGFLDEGNIPTKNYKDYRDRTKSRTVLGNCIKNAYAAVYATHENLHELPKDQVSEKFKIITGLGSDNKVLGAIVGSFLALIDLADFKSTPIEEKSLSESDSEDIVEGEQPEFLKKLGFSYTINLNLPATTDPRVYNAIFKSLRENIFK